MSQLVARILLTLFMVPIALLVFGLVVTVMESTHAVYSPDREIWVISISGAVAWGFIAGYWLLLWWRQIKWTAFRRIGTLLLVPAAIGLAAVIGLGVHSVERDRESGFIFGVFIAPLAWLFGTILLWRETRAERASRVIGISADAVTCPACGYNLTGLSDARCPECGVKFTLNELFAKQPAREAARSEQEFSN